MLAIPLSSVTIVATSSSFSKYTVSSPSGLTMSSAAYTSKVTPARDFLK